MNKKFKCRTCHNGNPLVVGKMYLADSLDQVQCPTCAKRVGKATYVYCIKCEMVKQSEHNITEGCQYTTSQEGALQLAREGR